MNDAKVCSKCKIDRPLGEFCKCKSNKDGLSSHCRLCIREKSQKYKAANRNKSLGEYPATKQCTKCKQIKPGLEFHKNSAQKSGLHGQCKECETARYKKERTRRYNKNKIYRDEHLSHLSATSRRKYKTPHGWFIKIWAALNQRTINGRNPNWNHKDHRRYLERGVRLEMGRDEFEVWVGENWSKIESIFATGKSPNIHRKDNGGHYSIGNIEILSSSEHAKLHWSLRRLVT